MEHTSGLLVIWAYRPQAILPEAVTIPRSETFTSMLELCQQLPGGLVGKTRYVHCSLRKNAELGI